MNIRSTILSMLLASCLTLMAETICDMGMARDWCDHTMLHTVEGIWEFPEDQTRVLVRRALAEDNKYEIIVIESPDTRIKPGDNIGDLTCTAHATKFEMSLYRTKKLGIFASPGKCLAELDTKRDAMIVKGRKMKFALASRWFLPSFWRAIRVTVKNPLQDLPKGMVRIYPSTVKRNPDYL